jgi:hypothetical protein
MINGTRAKRDMKCPNIFFTAPPTLPVISYHHSFEIKHALIVLSRRETEMIKFINREL